MLTDSSVLIQEDLGGLLNTNETKQAKKKKKNLNIAEDKEAG